jgi:hypothetical protein
MPVRSYSVSQNSRRVANGDPDRLVKSHGPAPQRRVIPTSKDCQSVNVNDRYDEIYAHSAGELIPIGVIENGAELLRLADKELKNPTNGQITYQRCTKMDGFTRKADGQPFYKDYDDFKSAVSELLETYAIPYKDVTGRDLDAYLETSIGAEETELQAGITQRSLDTQTAAESAEPAQPPTATTASDYAATRAERVRAKNTGGSELGEWSVLIHRLCRWLKPPNARVEDLFDGGTFPKDDG